MTASPIRHTCARNLSRRVGRQGSLHDRLRRLHLTSDLRREARDAQAIRLCISSGIEHASRQSHPSRRLHPDSEHAADIESENTEDALLEHAPLSARRDLRAA